MASKLLIDDYPIQVLPSLAQEIGLNEAIILQQMHYWLNSSKHKHDDKKWIYNSYSKWVKQFPFWSESTVKRAINSLEKQNMLFVGNYNKASFDKTKWYSINYSELQKRVTRPSGQNDPTMRSIWSDDEVNMTRPIPETTTETTTENKDSRQSAVDRLMKMHSNLGYGIAGASAYAVFTKYLDEGFTTEMIERAYQIGASSNNKRQSYINGIFDKWKKNGLKTIEDVDNHENKRRRQVVSQFKSNGLDDITEEDILGG